MGDPVMHQVEMPRNLLSSIGRVAANRLEMDSTIFGLIVLETDNPVVVILVTGCYQMVGTFILFVYDSPLVVKAALGVDIR